MGASKEWWQSFIKRNKFPTTGHFMIVPEDEPNAALLMHGETMLSLGITLDKGETLKACAEFFKTVLPDGKVAAPMYEEKTGE